MSAEQPIEQGQVWERRTDGTRIAIAHYDSFFQDVTYYRLDRSTLRRIFAHNLRANYFLAKEAGQP